MIIQAKKCHIKDIENINNKELGDNYSFNEGLYYVFIHRNKPIAAISYEKKKNGIAEINTLTVRKRYHGRGIGKLLINFLEVKMKNEKMKKITLGSLKRFKAKNFYLKCGFKRVKDYDNETYQFSKKLTKQ
jgi:GNAT superfamily N-acetyltransferase